MIANVNKSRVKLQQEARRIRAAEASQNLIGPSSSLKLELDQGKEAEIREKES
ncbi:MAG: hypothetical protein QXY34_00095 [Candidatus Bathyarchaeia archaeon]